MTNGNPINRDLRIIEYIDNNNNPWYYVQKRFFVFWLICLNREGFPSLEMAKQEINHYVLHD